MLRTQGRMECFREDICPFLGVYGPLRMDHTHFLGSGRKLALGPRRPKLHVAMNASFEALKVLQSYAVAHYGTRTVLLKTSISRIAFTYLSK